MYWQKPLASVPAALGHIHFAPVELASLVASPAQPKSDKIAPSPPTAPAVTPAAAPATLNAAAEAPAAIQDQLASLWPGTDEDVKSITVSTYVSGDLANPDETDLKARTRISLTGDVKTSLPKVAKQMSHKEAKYLELHQAMVKEALSTRLAYLKLLAQLVAGHSSNSSER